MNLKRKGTTGTFQCLDLFALSCLFLNVESRPDQILPPQNLSLRWITDFVPQLTWAPPPPHSMENCKYEVMINTSDKDSEVIDWIQDPQSPPWRPDNVVMGGGLMQLSVKTLCTAVSGDVSSEPSYLNVTYPELVRNLQCYIHSSKQTNCSWLPASDAQDIRFFYWLANEDFSISLTDNSPSPPLQECPLYNDTGGVRTGCCLQANVIQDIHILFNGTLNNTLVRNTFKKQLHDNVRPPPLKWTVTKTEDKFNISWIPPDINLSQWMFKIKYTACKKTSFETISGQTSTTLDVLSHCQYSMSIQATSRGQETPWSDEKHFDAATDPYVLVYVAIIIPLMFAVLAALTLVCCRKNKENIFPKVPEPRDLLSDIFDNNNKSAICHLYAPVEEEDGCKITLVTDLQITKLHP